MFGRKRLALDMLFATACCVIWVGLMTAAEDGSSANSTDTTAAGTTASPAKADSGELSLFLEPDTKATQTKPDNPEEVLKSGVTVASSNSAVNRRPASGIVPMGGRGGDKAPSSLRSRQSQLSLDGSPETIAADRPALGGQPATPRTFTDAGPVLEVYAADKSERSLDGANPVRPLAASSAATKAPAPRPQPQQAPPAPKPAAKPGIAASGQPANKPKPASSPFGSKPVPAPASASLTQSLPAADVGPRNTPARLPEEPAASAPGTPSLRQHFTGSDAAETSASVVLPAGEELVSAPLTPEATPVAGTTAETAGKSEPAIISGRLPKSAQPQPVDSPRPSLSQALNSGEIGAQVPALRPLNIGLMLALMGGLIALAIWLRGGRSPFSIAEKAVNVIETISIAPGRQIILVEMRGSALVLGVTPQSINLLDKVPLEVLQENYQPTVREIITREGAARADWAARPKVAAMGGGGAVGPRPAPPLGNSYGPPPQGRLSVQQLRQQRSGFHSYRDGGSSSRPPRMGELRVTERSSAASNGTSRLGKAELLDNLREQLRNREQ